MSGLIGAAYCVVVFRRIRRQTDYRPVKEDWLWYLVLPLLAYLLLLVMGLLFSRDPANTAFGFAAAVVILVLIGIHNAWDMISYMVAERIQSRKEP